MRKVCENGYKNYVRSRPGASKDSVRRAKSTDVEKLQVHPIFSEKYGSETDRLRFINEMRNYKPQTVCTFLNKKNAKNMKNKLLTKYVIFVDHIRIGTVI